jgi:hypothetical protein
MDEPDLPSIEDEFADLDSELKRIASLPVETAEQRNALLVALEAMRADWEAKGRAHPDAPEWRRAVDRGIAGAFDGLIGDLARAGSGGAFNFDNALLQAHLRPVFDVLADGLKRNLVQKFGQRPPPGVPPPKVDGADVAAMLLTLFGPPKKK